MYNIHKDWYKNNTIKDLKVLFIQKYYYNTLLKKKKNMCNAYIKQIIFIISLIFISQTSNRRIFFISTKIYLFTFGIYTFENR